MECGYQQLAIKLNREDAKHAKKELLRRRNFSRCSENTECSC
jgi:hypothetical protein